MKIYAARDMSGKLWIFFGKKPVKDTVVWMPMSDFCETVEDLPSVKWEDEEPTEVYFDEKDSHKLKVK